MITPKSIVSTDLENFKSKRYAINEPVQAPVNGNGTATNMINPRYSYLIILPSARSLVLLKSQSMTFVQNRNLLKNFSTNLKNKRTNGIGNMLPSIAKGKTCHKSQLNSHRAYGITYLDSIQGIIDPKNIWNHSGNISNMFYHLFTNKSAETLVFQHLMFFYKLFSPDKNMCWKNCWPTFKWRPTTFRM